MSSVTVAERMMAVLGRRGRLTGLLAGVRTVVVVTAAIAGLEHYVTVLSLGSLYVFAVLPIPLEKPEDAPVEQQVAVAMPLLEAVEHAALRARVPSTPGSRAAASRSMRCSGSGASSASTGSSFLPLPVAGRASRRRT
jgi:hypothetical protein